MGLFRPFWEGVDIYQELKTTTLIIKLTYVEISLDFSLKISMIYTFQQSLNAALVPYRDH